MPSAHTYTGSRASSRRRFHVAYSACQPAFSRAIDGADSGAASPSSPRRARSKSPWASPCRYSSGRSRPTSSVRRLNSGSSRLSNRPSSPRSRGRRTVIVPVIVLSRRGLPNPFRYPGAASTPSRRAYRRRPTTCSTSSSKSCCSNRWTPCRANASRLSHVGLDSAPVPVLFSFMGGVSFGGRSQRPRFGLWSPEGYTAFSSFTHPLTLPLGGTFDTLALIGPRRILALRRKLHFLEGQQENTAKVKRLIGFLGAAGLTSAFGFLVLGYVATSRGSLSAIANWTQGHRNAAPHEASDVTPRQHRGIPSNQLVAC